MDQKGNGLIAGIVIIALAVFLGGYYLKSQGLIHNPLKSAPVSNSQSVPTTSATPTTDISDWKTYKSDEYNFTLMYPPQVTHNETLSSTQFNKSHEFFKVDSGTLEIYGICGRGIQSIKQQDIVIDGQKATKLYETNTTGVITAIPRPNSNESICFNFTLPNDPNKINSVDTLFDQMLSTFKFTDQNKIADTTNWKSYTNIQYNYSVKYPVSWQVSDCANNGQTIEIDSKPYNCTRARPDIANVEISVVQGDQTQKFIDDRKNLGLTTIVPIIVSGASGKNLTLTPIGPAKTENPPNTTSEVYLVHNNNTYLIKLFTFGSFDSENQTFNQILSTFKFTD